jgi:hypothetical protein
MNIVMVIIHLLSIVYLTKWLLIITIPIHFLLIYTRKKEEKVDRNDFAGPRKMENLAYQDYLVRAYKIEKNDILGTYSVNKKTFENLQDALDEAYRIDTKD